MYVCLCVPVPVCVAVPDAPRSVQVVRSLPNELLVSVKPPDEDGGMPVTGYRVEFEDQAQDFDHGKQVTVTSPLYGFHCQWGVPGVLCWLGDRSISLWIG